ncbi:prolyl oligopeptidase family serine peptidase [Paenibacillus melissococcoides]|uniref:Prolyl oligopeptidase family serine peptidase n=1 Tax=Paenibacillus melissococcoides TaxID=2912268 RepID=A0ABM9FZP0_9BACL|nr:MULTISPECIES: prolyl oligopeptidase family serine peptidase [Paenibacillus]MEB9896545.1 prolyl oligopeptidase family serine peptidase [Bacillus cereus]CAH8244757.1 prolyl oligopeptidase family serine peptidase [Paenibacillus melissococcoides]CAH8708883.1 prolyl oligopeptidase family serine peptidase [Paenibacillus melissococcoides]CAH8709636.1 prolyl oligopeptidase family serine peptidase [Paenibacillus melissococcoides]GIO78219.1 putative peptidase YtmA [Paenibacillus dendritiformis]
MLLHLTYLSGGHKVTGYLSLPPGSRLDPERLGLWLRGLYACPELPRPTETACGWPPERRDMSAGRWPVLLYCRGGMGKFGRVRTHWLEQFSSHGYIVFAPCYRGNEGGEGRDEFGGADTEDVRAAWRMLAQLPFVDARRISIMGFSRGAINAARTAASAPGIHRLILWSGVSDLAQTYEERVDLRRMLKRVLGGTPARQEAAFRLRSPLHLAERIGCPVLLIHGTEDEQVPYAHAIRMRDRLASLGKESTLHAYAGEGHLFPPGKHREAVERMFRWIEETGR